MRSSTAIVAFLALFVVGSSARTLSGLLYTDATEIATVNAAQQKGASEYYASSAASATAGAQTNQIVTINGNGNTVNNDAVTSAIASADASSATDSTDVWEAPSSPTPTPTPAKSPSPSPIPTPSPSSSPSPSPHTPCLSYSTSRSPAPGASPTPYGSSPSPSGSCNVAWKAGNTGTWEEFHDFALLDPVILVDCSGANLSPKDRMSFGECSRRCTETPGCFAFLHNTADWCTFVANDNETPMKKSSGNNAYFWGGAVETIDSSFLPKNCAANTTVPHI